MAYINIRLDKNFTTAFNRLRNKYGKEIARLNGFADSQLSYTDFIDNFVDTETVADASVDGNANVGHKDIVTLLNEMPKPHRKLLAYNKIYYEINKKYGFQTANQWIEKEWNKTLYMHDADTSSFKPYCYAYDLKELAEKGLFFLENFNSEPPKHLGTFVDFVKEFISYVSNRTSGAAGLPNLIPYMYYFWREDVKNNYYTETKEKYARQHIQRFIYAVNQPCVRDNMQSAFTNTNIFDRPYLEALFGGAEFPDGSFMIDDIDGIMEFQKLFLEVMSEIRSKNMFTFPVNTISLLKQEGKFVDEDFARYASEHNRKWNDSNIFADSSVNSLSNCPLSPDTDIVYWSEHHKRYFLSPIKEVYANKEKREGKDFIVKVLSNGKEINCKINKFNEIPDYEIELVNGAKIRTTANHLNKTFKQKEVRTKDLTVNDYLPYGLHKFKNNDSLTYEEGKIVGAFLGDGSYSQNGITLSLHSETDRNFMDWLQEYIPRKFGGICIEDTLTSNLSSQKKCVNFRIQSPYLLGLVKQYVVGDSALEKEINLRALNASTDFRQGIIDGWYQTDGGNNNRIYSASIKLIKTMTVIFSSLGIVTRINTDERENRLGNNPVYTLRFYSPGDRKKLKDVYIIDDDFMWIKIKSITRVASRATTSYCLEVQDDVEPIFMLGNGVLTHNCRLKSNIEDLGFFSSIGGTALRVGSVKVSTINIARLALEYDNEKDFMVALRDLTELNLKALDVVRSIIVRNVEKGLLPNYAEGLIDIKTQYNTIGVIGTYEAIKTFGYIEEDEFGNTFYTDEAFAFGKKLFSVIHTTKDHFALDKDYMINVEAIPGESAAVKMQAADEIFYPETVVKDLPLYGNQFIPLGIKTTLHERIRIASAFDEYCNGGSILHVNIEAPFQNEEQAWDMLNYITDQGVTYFAFNTKIQACEYNHAFFGKECPECGGPVTTEYTRIVGFYTPIKTWSKKRKEEYELREWEGSLNEQEVRAG